MAKVLIVYATDYGNTEKMAIALEKGVASVAGAVPTLKTTEDVSSDDFLTHDAIVFGSPVHMGSPDWRIKKVIDQICSKLWMKDLLIGKVGAVFVSGGGYGGAGGGCELTMLAMLNNFAELGLIMVPLPKNTPGFKAGGIQWGPYGKSLGPNMEQIGVQPEGLEAAMNHGVNIAQVTLAVAGKKLFGAGKK